MPWLDQEWDILAELPLFTNEDQPDSVPSPQLNLKATWSPSGSVVVAVKLYETPGVPLSGPVGTEGVAGGEFSGSGSPSG